MNKVWSQIITLFQESTVTQSTVTIALVGANVYLWVTAQAVPSELYGLTLAVVGFWFGTKLNFRNATLREIDNVRAEVADVRKKQTGPLSE